MHSRAAYRPRKEPNNTQAHEPTTPPTQAAPLSTNLPVLLGLLSLWNISFLGYPARALLPYCQALSKFAPHIQQVSMESNGKGVDMEGRPLSFEVSARKPGERGATT